MSTDELELSYELSGARNAGISFADFAALRRREQSKPTRVTVATSPAAPAPTESANVRSVGNTVIRRFTEADYAAHDAAPASATTSIPLRQSTTRTGYVRTKLI